MTRPSAPDWALIRQRYENTQDTVADICSESGVSQRDLANRRKREKWRRANPRPFPPPRRPAGRNDTPTAIAANDKAAAPGAPAPTSQPPPQELPASPSGRRRLLDRLVDAIDLKLRQLERRMAKELAQGDDAPATDHERETRAIGVLIDNLEKITEMETGLSPASRNRAGSTTPSDLADEAERCRRELAERLSRIIQTRGSGT